ncbi:polysaccharide deacetylase family protein [Hymenobacter sp. BT559]|uniref:polysaccharide deacetylase family protein n=1 Tax=Hymenobacter sp. BT559 TaxID=2795729 RepID=UPI0018EB1D8A|nr:polysaccharide deacetylase family protein [Hymenobacter sp. BT559]MBJ6143665.1 polysaccharide deacetylase family protein [Hymenobacter sp. BT559]
MRILHVLSANFFAGSVAYAVALAEAHRRQGHQVWLASDAASLPTAATVVQLPISQRKYRQRWHNIQALRQLIKEQAIDVVHAHSRAASWVSYFAVRGLPVPLVSTVHGRQHLHTSTSLFDVYGDKVIAICENLAEHLRTEVKMAPSKLAVVPNGIAFAPLGAPPLADTDKVPRMAFIGRFNGPKGEQAAALCAHVFPPLLREHAGLRVALIGGELDYLPAAGKAALGALQTEFGERIEVVGFTDDVPGWLEKTDLVIGAGRVVMEALGAGVAALAMGEACYAGRVTEATYETAAASNFGDILAQQGVQSIDWQLVLHDAQDFWRQPSRVAQALQQRVRADYDLAAIAARVLGVYESARMKKAVPGFIPVLMYHKIPDAPLASKHQIFVTKENFAKHLTYFQQQKFTPITFRDYQEFASGQRPLAEFPRRPLILTFDDGYVDNYTNLLPLMQQAGYRGVLYLLGDFGVRYNYWDVAADPTEPRADIMDAAQKQAFVAAGWEIGAHTMRHPKLPELPAAEAAAEIEQSKTALEQVLGTEIISFAYPYGALTEQLKAQVQQAGFTYAVATDTGGMHLEDDRMQIFRINMFPHETAGSLFKKTAPWYRRYYRWKRKK